MSPTVGFIPSPAAPLLIPATNAIVPTTGLLGGAAAGAAAGAKIGVTAGLAGLAVGAAVGAGIGLLLLVPSPLAPGTLPENSPEPTPSELEKFVDYPDGVPLEYPPGADPSVAASFKITFESRSEASTGTRCDDGSSTPAIINPPTTFVKGFSGTLNSASFQLVKTKRICSDTGGSAEIVPGYEISYTTATGRPGLERTNVLGGTLAGSSVQQTSWQIDRIVKIERNGEPLGMPEEVKKKQFEPRTSPVPIRPIPAPEPQPAPTPLPDQEPQPEPLIFPSPETPEAPPVTIPKAPPGKPQPVPTQPTRPSPLPVPAPDPVPAPLPVPGAPPVPSPSPDPNPQPVPGPDPAPLPGPIPLPGPDPLPTPGPDPSPTPLPQTPPLPEPIIPPIPETPPETTPTDPDGNLTPLPTPGPTPTPPGNHYPVPGGPPVTDGGTRPTPAAIAAEVGRIEQKVARLQNPGGLPDLGNLIPLLGLLQDLFETPIPATTYQLTGICEETDENGNQPVAEFEVPEAFNFDAVVARLDKMDAMLQQHLAWKTPTCSRRPVLTGDWRTISFISDENSGTRGDRLRKRFRYRSVSGIGLPGVIDHWANFTWQAGAVCVQHAGSTWGTPQVWAASIDEGKRVIRHAAGEAGIDPDKDGRWVVSGSDSARVGLPGTMRVNRKGGYYWITARDGPSGPPIVGTTP